MKNLSDNSYLSYDDDLVLTEGSQQMIDAINEPLLENFTESSLLMNPQSLCSSTNVLHTSISSGKLTCKRASLSLEVWAICQSSTSLIITFLLQYSLIVTSVFSVGNMGSNELGAVTLANLLANVTCYGIVQGISSSLSTLCPQAYGKGNYKLVGLHSMRCLIILMFVFIPTFIFWFYGSYPLLLMAINDVTTCLLASKYLRILVWGVPSFIIFEVLKQYLQAQGIFHASTYVLFICAPLNIILNYILVWNKHFGLGFVGAPLATVITNWIMTMLLLSYTVFIDGYQCWCGISKDWFSEWKQLLTLAGPGVIMIEGEWVAFEIISLASSRFGVDALAAQSVISTICVLIYQISFAISVVVSTRVAWNIGSHSKEAAIVTTKASLLIATIVGCFDALFLGIGRSFIASLFSNDPAIIALSSHVLVIGSIYQIADSISCITGGILRGQGRQYIGGWLTIISYYVLALPVAFLCGFCLDLELFGLWIGMIVALSFVAICATFIVFNTNWDNILKQCCENGYPVGISTVDTQSIHSSTHTGRFVAFEGHVMLTPVASINSSIDHNFLGPLVANVPIPIDKIDIK